MDSTISSYENWKFKRVRRHEQDTRDKTLSTRHNTQDTWHKTQDTRHLAQDTRHLTQDTRHLIQDTKIQDTKQKTSKGALQKDKVKLSERVY